MSRGPRRLLDDPDFQWETGCDLADEQSLVGGYELASAKEAVLAKVGVAALGGSAAAVGDGVPAVRAAVSGAGKVAAVFKPLAFATVGVAAVGTAFWLGTVTGSGNVDAPVAPVESAAEAPIPEARISVLDRDPVAPEAPAPEHAWWLVPPHEGPDVAPTAADTAAPVLAVRRVASPTVPPAEDAGEPALDREVEVPEATPPEAQEKPPVQASPGVQLVHAMEHCETIHASRARAECYREMLHSHGGVSDAMIELAWVRALRDAGDVEGTAALAARMRQDPAHGFRSEELLMLEAESLAKLGRCDTALLRARELPRTKAATIREACRGRK